MAIQTTTQRVPPPATPEPTEAEAPMPDTGDLPLTIVDGTPRPGDVISVTVVSVDEGNGTMTVTKTGAGPEEQTPEAGGSEAMAAEFENPPPA